MMDLKIFAVLICSFVTIRCQTSRPRPKELLVMTVATNANHDGYQQFLDSCNKHGLKLETVAAGLKWTGGDIEKFAGGGMKINQLKAAVEKYKDREDLALLVTDSYDAIMHGTENEILDAFVEYKAGVVCSAEVFIWPDASLASKYPPARSGESRYLNSGGFMGYATDLYQLLTDHEIADSDDDQLYFTNLFLDEYQNKLHGGSKYTETEEPALTPAKAIEQMNIKLDKRSIIFQTLNGVLDQVDIKYKNDNSYLFNQGSGSTPLVVHGNGPIKHKFNRMVSYLNGAWTPTHGCLSCKRNVIDVDSLEELPTMYMTLMVVETTPFLHHWLARVDALDYPKDKLDVFVFNQHGYHEEVVSAWVEKNKDTYKSLEYVSSEKGLNAAQGKNQAMSNCKERKCEYLLSIDSLVQVTKTDIIQHLLGFNRSSVSPMITRPGLMFSTFWADTTPNGYYQQGENYKNHIRYEMISSVTPLMVRPGLAWSTMWGNVSPRHYYERADDYTDLITNKQQGLWNVPYASGLHLIKGSKLSLLPEDPYSAGDMFPPQDYDVAFAYNCRKTGLFMHVVNLEAYGHLVNPDSYDTSRAVPDLYEQLTNKIDWEMDYLHPDYHSLSANDTAELEEPCQDVYWFPIVTGKYCEDLIHVMETFGKWSGGGNTDERLAGGYENVPTRDIHMNQVGLEPQWIRLLKDYVHPVQLKVFSGYHSELSSIMNFVVRYRPDEQPSLRPHHDSSTFTVNMALNTLHEDYEGGGVKFIRYNCTLVGLRKGWMLMHPGRLTHFHEGLETTGGTRYIMVSFVNP